MVRPLSDRPSFESLRKEAKRRLRELRVSGSALGLREVQQMLAREHGFAGWAALKEHCELRALDQASEAERVAEFLTRACLSYGRDDWPDKWRRAERIRMHHPEVARANLYCACVAGELERVRELLAADATLATRPGGPQAWPPLLFVCYGRLPHPPAGEHALAIARLLLDHGADPDSYFLWDDTYHFSAMTGAIGKGELGQPAPPRARELVELLLARGASPNEGQGLYDDMLEGDDPTWLELLLAHGLTAEHLTNWSSHAPMRLLDYLLGHAIKEGHIARARCLLAHGARPDVPDYYDHRTGHENAMLAGNLELAELLLQHGATPAELGGRDAFVAACMRVDAPAARRLLDGHPEYLEHVDPLIEAAERGRVEPVRLMLDLGTSPNRVGKHDKLPLHVASGREDGRELVALLLDGGADACARVYGGTAARWAIMAGQIELARFIAERSRHPHDAAESGHVELLAELLAQDASAARRVDPNGNTPLHRLPEDVERAREVLELLLRHGADAAARNQAGLTPAAAFEERGLDELADLVESRSGAA